MNIGDRIVILQEELKFEDERQEILYTELHRQCGPWPDDLEKILSSGGRQELITLCSARKREESKALTRRPESLTWMSAEETERNLGVMLCDLKRTNRIVERIIEILKKAKRYWGQIQG